MTRHGIPVTLLRKQAAGRRGPRGPSLPARLESYGLLCLSLRKEGVTRKSHLGLDLPEPASVSSSAKGDGAIADDLEIHVAFSPRQKASWLILKEDADTRTNSPELDSRSLSLSSGTDREPLQTVQGDSFYPREWFF